MKYFTIIPIFGTQERRENLPEGGGHDAPDEGAN